MVLRLGEDVILFLKGGHAATASLGKVVGSWVVAQTIVEGALVVSRLVNGLKATRVRRNVRVSAHSIISVHHWSRVNVSQAVSGSLLLSNEGCYITLAASRHLQTGSIVVGCFYGWNPPLILYM